MPIDAVWILATVPQKAFEKTVISLNRKTHLHPDYSPNDKLHDDYYIERNKKVPYMENILKDALEYLNINDSVWNSSENGHYYQVYFTSDVDNNDSTLHYLKSKGIGSKGNSTIGYIPFGLFYSHEKPSPDDRLNSIGENYVNEIKDSFLKSVTSRLTVAQVVDGVRTGSEITFDYYMYLLFSCIIAAMGILNSSPIDVAASMMIEPIMSAVMAVSFGLALLNRHLIWTGLKSLFVGLTFCFLFGYIYGLIFQIWRNNWDSSPTAWPTQEMISRGQMKTLIYGTFIATAGGAVLAIILLKNNIVALTGVAVATTFMPPFVNGGLCLALATHLQISSIHEPLLPYNSSGQIFRLKPSWTPHVHYNVTYFHDMRLELVALAAVSLAYTFINVFFLLASSFILLKIKEIAPLRRLQPSEQKFFSEDMQVYREHMRKHPESTNMGQDILSEWADMTGNRKEIIGDDPISKATQYQTLKDIVKDVESDANYQNITRNAFGNRYQGHLRRRLTAPTLTIDPAELGDSPLSENMNIFSINSAISAYTSTADLNSELNYATIRQNDKNAISYPVDSPFSLWPSNTDQLELPTGITRSGMRSSNRSFAFIPTEKKNSLISNHDK